jgi:hypothetical protein
MKTNDDNMVWWLFVAAIAAAAAIWAWSLNWDYFPEEDLEPPVKFKPM